MLDVSAAYIAAIKDKNRTDRITGMIKLCDGETINITDDIIVNNSVTLKEQLVSGDTFEIGTFYTNQLDITVYDDNFLSRTYANARITPKYEIQLADGAWESVPIGIFTVDNSLTKRKGSIHKLTAFDDSTKFDVDISAYSGGKKTVQQHIKDLAADVGITLATTDFSSYPNYNLIVDSTVSSSVQTYRDLIEWCCALMAASARINRYGKLEIVKLKEKKKTVDDTLVYDADYTVEGYERTGTEFFDLRALTKYFSTTFDGEQYVYANNSALEDTVARKATLFLPENPLLRSVTDAERKSAFEACADEINIALRRVEFSFNGNPAIECFDTLCGNGGKIDVNRTIAFFPTSLVWKYRGAHKVSCAFAELTDETIVSASEVATLAADEATATKKVPVQIKNKTEKRLDGVGKIASEAGGVGEYTNTDKNCEIFNDYENNTAGAEYSHAEGRQTTASAPYSHAEGHGTVSSNTGTHAEGRETTASGAYSHAENTGCIASGSNSHAEGYYTMATGEHSHASGNHTVAENEVFALGNYNKTTADVLLVVGNGWEGQRSDALTLDRSGNLHIAGKLTADGGAESGGGSGEGYVLPAATRYTLGGVMIGDNLLVSESGIIAADLSKCVKSSEIADWAKQTEKPSYTAEEVGAAAENHAHSVSDITDMPVSLPANGGNADTVDCKHASDFAAAGHTHTAAEVGAATSADIKAAVNAVSIGGRNIARGTDTMKPVTSGNSDWKAGTWRCNRTNGDLSVVDITDSPVEGVTKAARLTVNNAAAGACGIVQQYTPLVAGQQYILSCWIRGTATSAQLEVYYAVNIRGGPTTISVTPQWQHVYAICGNTAIYNVPPETKTYSASYVYILPKNDGDFIEVCGLKLEKGNKPTDWSPAPEDFECRITSLEARVAALEAVAVSGGEV